MENKEHICCICGEEIEGYGNNPYGAMWKDQDGNIIEPEFSETDRCCNFCNQIYVVPGRLYRAYKNKGNK